MSIIGGLVGSHAGRLHVAKTNPLGEWAIRNAWALVLAGSIMFWVVLGAILIYG